MPKFSVVMPTRNRSKIIGESIKSIIDQTFSDWEFIIVDDSDEDDGTSKIVNDFNDRRIKYHQMPKKNGSGIACARNFGNALAIGEYIVVADSDDINYPDRLELTLQAFKGGADVVYGHYDEWNPDTDEIKKSSGQYEPRDFNLEYFKNYDFIPHPTTAYKRQIALDFPYNSFFRKAEDYDLFSRLAVYGFKFYFINKQIVKYRRHSGSITYTTDSFDYDQKMREFRGWK